jgi:N-acetylmuramoyl-L-alanine amidase
LFQFTKKMLFAFAIIACLFSCKSKPVTVVEVAKKDTIKPKPVRTKPLVVIDAGHGGIDPGAISDTLNIYEKNVSRKIVDAVKKIIDTSKIILVETRPKDSNAHRHDRINYATTLEPNLLLTVHSNHAKDTTISGFEVAFSDSSFAGLNGNDTIKIMNPNRPVLIKYGETLKKQVAKNFPKLRARPMQFRKDDIWMIYAPKFPSMLLEFGFLSNKGDAVMLNDKKELEKVASAIVGSLYQHFDIKFEKKSSQKNKRKKTKKKTQKI